MINNVGKLYHIKSYDENDVIYVVDGNSLPISHIGDVCVLENEGKSDLKARLVVHNLKKNLLPIEKFTTYNLCNFEFTSSNFFC